MKKISQAATTGIIVMAVIFLLIIYDIYAYSQGGQKATISWLIYDSSHEHPLIPFATGVLCGHFFWNLKRKKESKDG